MVDLFTTELLLHCIVYVCIMLITTHKETNWSFAINMVLNMITLKYRDESIGRLEILLLKPKAGQNRTKI